MVSSCPAPPPPRQRTTAIDLSGRSAFLPHGCCPLVARVAALLRVAAGRDRAPGLGGAGQRHQGVAGDVLFRAGRIQAPSLCPKCGHGTGPVRGAVFEDEDGPIFGERGQGLCVELARAKAPRRHCAALRAAREGARWALPSMRPRGKGSACMRAHSVLVGSATAGHQTPGHAPGRRALVCSHTPETRGRCACAAGVRRRVSPRCRMAGGEGARQRATRARRAARAGALALSVLARGPQTRSRCGKAYAAVLASSPCNLIMRQTLLK